MPDRRGRLLHAVVGFAALRAAPRCSGIVALHGRLDSWRGVGDVVVGMHGHSYDVQLTQYDERGWRATFTFVGEVATPRAPYHCMADSRLA